MTNGTAIAIDLATWLSYLAVYENKDAAATDFFQKCPAFLPFRVTKLLMDNGREFTLNGFRNRWGNRVNTKHTLDTLCEALVIEHRTTRPYTPRTNGVVERMIELTTEAHRYQTVPEMKANLHCWFMRYNF